MIIQDDPSTKLHHNNGYSSPAKPKSPLSSDPDDNLNLDLNTISQSHRVYLITTILTLAVVACCFFVFLRTSAANSTTPLLCSKNSNLLRDAHKLKIPKLDPNVRPIPDKSSPYASFRAKQWIVVSVSDHPSVAVKSLVRIKGWQVLAIGNSKTPKFWSLKGAIYLSLEQQAELGFRVLDHLPYDSYIRKTVGYLFAIHHGARRIFDADDRGEVIGGNIGKHFDLDLETPAARQQRIFQYNGGSSNKTRTIVNPYIHFGQRSVWPRGLPLENVGEVIHEEFYSVVAGGKQYIQQGISNGLPDVDSVFYATRKADSEAFDIRFDDRAPKVAMPEGVMAPVNSINTLFQYEAFWALMLPVSVSRMASDVLRGYWGQRLLWEIGGFVVFYPPTVNRPDVATVYPFIDETDLHVNVGRLIKFLIAWRSKKEQLFDRILDLSYSMEEEGFWNENDVKFTASWLEDLISVGYLAPGKIAMIESKTERMEFVPRKLPSKHLSVDESGTVNYEIGNLVRWRRTLGDIVLIMFVAGPSQRTALEWRLLYGRVFKAVVIMSTQGDADLAVYQARLDYTYLPRVFNRYNDTAGFIFMHDNTVLNYWSLSNADKSKLWIANKVPVVTPVAGKDEARWLRKQAEMVNTVVSAMPAHLQVNYKESSPSKKTIALCGSNVFYLPRRFVPDFVDLVDLVGDLDIHHKIAVPMFFMAMDSPQNFDPILNDMIHEMNVAASTESFGFYSTQAPAVHPCNVTSESDFVRLIKLMAAGDPLLMELF
ncbi:probable glycosyltransferase STELLO1 isoform X2 [Andrographis paniculata]|uniref:probable glycosyltransferase STELLO1 isoform X2 n=1 Tax=Andrographis paniculata TaxID=175694 RepID=UPI0021E8015C|nr:probable glycosyltransferase STELLO1 isoform X2 [Andrographis paniculata]